MTKELLFSVTAKDCDWEYYRGSGKGGQKKQKTSSAVRCTHRASGAVGRAQDTRSKEQNRRLAFRRMHDTKKFKNWIKLEVAKVTGIINEVQRYVDQEINSDNIRVEVQQDGKWVCET